ncbi:hypothetical protein ACIBBD_25845 [Streptomyces sp. NPDC051315]|uniref:hypothetical protein n=1 Tax=Streptomyces sp. NPDC051315 TaxID=3365650 RepID=UPI00379C7E1F
MLPHSPSPASPPLSASRPAPPSVFPSAPRPPGADVPATCEVPPFAPVRVRGGRYGLRRLVRSRRRALALGLAVTAAALVAACPGDADRARGHPGGDAASRARSSTGDPVRRRPGVETVEAPVRIADAATVRLLRPGDRVDVIAAEQTATGGEARVVARRALVTKVPEPLDGPLAAIAGDSTDALAGAVDGGALVVLSVPRPTAARLAGAGATARLAVTLW